MLKKEEFSELQTDMVQNILILGANGYIGGTVCRRFAETKDFNVLALIRPGSQAKEIEPFCKKIICSEKSQFSVKEIQKIIRQQNIKTIINLAWDLPAASTVEAQFAKDRLALEAAFTAAASISSDIHVITTSGNFSLMTTSGGRITETPPPRGFVLPSYLSCVELLVQVNVLKDGLTEKYISKGGNASIIYPGSVYGASPTRNGFWDFAIQQFITGQAYLGFKPFPRDFMTGWIHLEDLAECYIAATRRHQKGSHYLATGENLSISQMATLFAETAGVKFDVPLFSNTDRVFFDDSHTRKLLQLEWKHQAVKQIKTWIDRIKDLGNYFLD